MNIPYGHTTLTIEIDHPIECIMPAESPAADNPRKLVRVALARPVGTVQDFADAESVAIAINDKTRPVPHADLLPPLLDKLAGIPPEAITFVIANGSHPPMTPDEFHQILPPDIIEQYNVISHNAEDEDNLRYIGETQRGTPVYINRHFADATMRVVVGNMEPHQFMGFSGGVKSAAIGLAGKATINHNHALMTEPNARLGVYNGNPARADVEEIGQLVGIQLALNAILNGSKQIVHVIAGEPLAVMQAGMPLVRDIYQVPVEEPYDVVITSPGGHPKDINLYQAQKALAHARLITKPGGTIILVAACPEGTGSLSYEEWMSGVDSYEAVFERFAAEGFRIGPHKAYQIARDSADVNVMFLSNMDDDFVRGLLLEPIPDLETGIARALETMPPGGRIAALPVANATIPG